jgi:hypothetical protein
MKTRIAFILVLSTVTAASLAPAQEVVGEVDPVLLNDISPKMESAQERGRDRERAEDMAILSQILYEDLLRLYLRDPHAALPTANTTNDPNTAYDEMATLFLGVRTSGEVVGRPLAEYLPGYGVVVQVAAPPPQREVVEMAKDDVSLSRWEATRRRIRGEAVYDSATCTACHAPASIHDFEFFSRSRFNDGADPHQGVVLLTDAARRRPTQEQLIAALADVLSEAGGRLRHIQPDERITISMQYVPDAREPGDEEFLRRVYLDLIGHLPTPEEVQSFLQDDSSEKRTKLIENLLDRGGSTDEKSRRWKNLLESREGDGPDASAESNGVRNAIDDLILHRLQQAAPPASEPRLSGRISVTATKRQIDALAAGALDREEFGKQVVVRTVNGGGE